MSGDGVETKVRAWMNVEQPRTEAMVAVTSDPDAFARTAFPNTCMDCDAPLVPCTCAPDCPGGMCSSRLCNPRAPAPTGTL